MTHPHYFSGIENSNMEVWALVDSTGHIALLDQNLFVLKMLEMIPFTNNFKIVRLKDVQKFSSMQIDNGNCTQFRIFGGKFFPAVTPALELQDRLFGLRQKYLKILEIYAQNDLMQHATGAALILLMFGNNPQAVQTSLEELNRFSDDVIRLDEQIRQAYESH